MGNDANGREVEGGGLGELVERSVNRTNEGGFDVREG